MPDNDKKDAKSFEQFFNSAMKDIVTTAMPQLSRFIDFGDTGSKRDEKSASDSAAHGF
jgi:hypothetical protein